MKWNTRDKSNHGVEFNAKHVRKEDNEASLHYLHNRVFVVEVSHALFGWSNSTQQLIQLEVLSGERFSGANQTFRQTG